MHGLTGGGWKRSVGHGHRSEAARRGNPGKSGCGTYRRATSPRQPPTLHRIGVSSLAYNRLDAHVWRLTWKWARHTHPDKPRHWVVTRYFGMFNPSRNDRWLFGSRETGHYLRRFAWTKIVRHTLVAGRASPDDPALAGYWAKRRERIRPPVSPATWHLLRRQHGRCPLCRGLLLYASHEPHDEREWEQWHTVIRKAIRKEAVATVMDLG